jgi:hypothetical protein
MSKLVDLFNGSQYARLDTISGHSPNNANPQSFSVREQSNTEQNIRQGNATDFFGNTYQEGFNVDKPSLSVAGFQKSPLAQTSDYTGNATGLATTETNAFDSYNRFANDGFRNTYESKLVHRYLATDSSKTYLAQNSTAQGAILSYNK